jgi:fluoroquinolone transport system permease protein
VIFLARKLACLDLKLVWRDRFLLMMFLVVLYLAAVLRYGLPWLNTYLDVHGVLPSATVSMSLTDVYPMLIAFLVIFQGALIAGTIVGFMLLDEKEDGTLKVILVTPVPFRRYVWYRVATPMALSFVVVVAMAFLIDQAVIPLGQLLLIAAGAALTAPIGSLFYVILAENKVQGFALAKFVGIVGWLILLGWFVPEPWQWLFGLFPPFLISKAYWMAFEGRAWWWVALLAGVVLQAGVIAVLVQRFHRVVYR